MTLVAVLVKKLQPPRHPWEEDSPLEFDRDRQTIPVSNRLQGGFRSPAL